jgi:hypothetical protein
VLDPVSIIPKWNARMDNYVISIFSFANKYLTRDGYVFFYYDDHFRVLKDIKSYLEDYNFEIHSKFVVVNNMHNTNPEFPNKKVIIFSNSNKASNVRVNYILIFLLYYLSQTLMGRALLLVHENGNFVFSTDPQDT